MKNSLGTINSQNSWSVMRKSKQKHRKNLAIKRRKAKKMDLRETKMVPRRRRKRETLMQQKMHQKNL